MTAEKLICELQKFPPDFEVYAINDKGQYRRVENVDKDDNYKDILVVAGDVE